MMTDHEKWEYQNDLDEITDRLSSLMASIMLTSIKKLDNEYKPRLKKLDSNQENDLVF